MLSFHIICIESGAEHPNYYDVLHKKYTNGDGVRNVSECAYIWKYLVTNIKYLDVQIVNQRKKCIAP